MRTLLFTVVLVLTAATATPGEPPAGLPWETDWDSAFSAAKTGGKLVFVDFYADWCGPCRVMETNVFPDERVQKLFGDYVLLRVDFDKGLAARARRVSRIPTYLIYDYAQRERVRFSGAMPPDKFAAALSEVKAAAPLFLRAAQFHDTGSEAEAWLSAGNGYLRLQMADKARSAYDKALKEARRGEHAETAKLAAAQRAYTWTVEGKPDRTLKEIQAVTAQTVSPDADALAWLITGRAAEKAKDAAVARKAYEQAVAADPGGAVAQQATAALAGLRAR